MKIKSSLKISIFSLLIFGLLFLHFYAPRFITEIRNPLIELLRARNQTTPLPDKQNQKTITFRSFDNTKISCLITYSQLDSTYGTIILLHGIRSNKNSFSELSDKLSEIGYNSVTVDSRAHGQSEGQFCTFGVKEKKDISNLIDTLITIEKLDSKIGVWGQSLGGAIGLQTMSIDKRIEFGIIESTFTDFNTITQDYFKFHLGFNLPPLTKYLIYRAGVISDFDPSEAKPIEYCKKIDQPILIVHGNNDKRISIEYAKENFDNISSNKKTFLEIEGANHLNVWNTGGNDYFENVFEFIKRNTNGNNGYK